MDDDYENVEVTLCQINQCFVYKLPPRTTVKGYRAADWNASEPLWTGRLLVLSKGDQCVVKLQDADSGELFATCPVDETAIEPVTDSSRYFVLRIESGGKHAFIGIGFAERDEAFNFNVAVQDHKKHVRQAAEAEAAKKRLASEPEVDYSLAGPIKVTLNVKKAGSGAKKKSSQSKSSALFGGGGGGGGLLPPPPSASTSVKPVRGTASSSSTPSAAVSAADPFAAFGDFSSGGGGGATSSSSAGANFDPFADFGSASQPQQQQQQSNPFGGSQWSAF